MFRTSCALVLAALAILAPGCGDDGGDVPAGPDLVVARVGTVEQPGVLAAMEPCQEDDPGSGCTSITHPVSRRFGRTLPNSVNLQIRAGTEIAVDVGGPTNGIEAHLVRYVRRVGRPLAGGSQRSAPSVRITALRRDDESGRRWTLTVPEVPPAIRPDLLVLRVDHDGKVGTPRSTAAGPAGSEALKVAWYEVRVRLLP